MLTPVPSVRRLAALALVLLVIACPEAARAQLTLTLPDVVVTSMTASGADKYGMYWSGIRPGAELESLGNATGGTFPAGTYAAGTTITLTIRPTAGYVFQLKANDAFLFNVAFTNATGGGATINYSATTATFLGVQGGTLDGDNQFDLPAIATGYENTNYYTIYNSGSLFQSGLGVTGTTTFEALRFTTVLNSELTFSELSFSSLTLAAHSAAMDTLTLVSSGSAVPEPSTYAGFAGVLALGFAAVWRRRGRPSVGRP